MPTYLGLDYGARRVGIAVSDDAGSFAFALDTHVEGRDGSLLQRLQALVAERGVAGVVLGLPLTADGREGDIAVQARRFGERLAAALPVPVILWDDRYTSQEADRWLAGRRRAKGERDAVAAELILQGWLDRQAADRRRAADADEDADEPAGEEGET
jgi:putative Holliday junction resolvase